MRRLKVGDRVKVKDGTGIAGIAGMVGVLARNDWWNGTAVRLDAIPEGREGPFVYLEESHLTAEVVTCPRCGTTLH